MSWILVTLVAYFLNAVSSLLDKVLLSGRIQSPAVFAFFVSLFSLVSFVFAPFGFSYLGLQATGIFLLSGALFLYSLVFLYQSIQGNELSRIAPLVGTIASLITIGGGYVGIGENTAFTGATLLALLFLIGGGLLLAFDLPLRPKERIPRTVLLSGIALGISLLLLKMGYDVTDGNFVSGLVWSRFGIFLGGLSLLLLRVYRHDILKKLSHFRRPNTRGATTGLLFIVNKSCAGAASFLMVYAASLGPIAFVTALSGFQYLFLLFLIVPLAHRFPKTFHEELSFSDWLQKIVAILLIGLGLWFGGLSGIKLL